MLSSDRLNGRFTAPIVFLNRLFPPPLLPVGKRHGEPLGIGYSMAQRGKAQEKNVLFKFSGKDANYVNL